MNDPTELLLQLRDIHQPPAPTDSSGVFLALMILGTILLLLLLAGIMYWRRQALKRSVRAEIRQVKTLETNTNNALHQLAVILRRTMHHIHGDTINQLDNERWLQKLDSTFNTRFFTQGQGSVFGHTLYQPRQADSVDTAQLCNELDMLLKKISLRPVT